MKKLDAYKLIIFDCDGTLVDSERLSNQLIAEMMLEIGVPMTEDQSLSLFKGTHFKHITDYAQKHAPGSLPFDFEHEYRKRCATLFEDHLKEVTGASEFIRGLNSAFCVASNGPRVKMKTSLSVTGLDKLIDASHIFSAYDIGRFKPDPHLFLYAADQMGFEKEDTLVIEDTVPGIDAAQNADMDVVAIHHPGINDEILDYGIPVFPNFREFKI